MQQSFLLPNSWSGRLDYCHVGHHQGTAFGPVCAAAPRSRRTRCEPSPPHAEGEGGGVEEAPEEPHGITKGACAGQSAGGRQPGKGLYPHSDAGNACVRRRDWRPPVRPEPQSNLGEEEAEPRETR